MSLSDPVLTAEFGPDRWWHGHWWGTCVFIIPTTGKRCQMRPRIRRDLCYHHDPEYPGPSYVREPHRPERRGRRLNKVSTPPELSFAEAAQIHAFFAAWPDVLG